VIGLDCLWPGGYNTQTQRPVEAKAWREAEWNFKQLFANGARQNRARFPLDGYYIAEKALDATQIWFEQPLVTNTILR